MRGDMEDDVKNDMEDETEDDMDTARKMTFFFARSVMGVEPGKKRCLTIHARIRHA